jgi:hypothetical protein
MAVVLTPAALPANTVVTGKIVNPLKTSVQVTFEESYQRKLAWSWGGAVKVAREARFVVAMSDTGVDIWRIKERRRPNWDEGVIAAGDEAALANGEGDDGGGWDKCLEIQLNVQTNLLASAVSDNGQWLVVSDLYETKLFALETTAVGVSHLPLLSIEYRPRFDDSKEILTPAASATSHQSCGRLFRTAVASLGPVDAHSPSRRIQANLSWRRA